MSRHRRPSASTFSFVMRASFLFAQISDRNIRAFARKEDRNGPPDTGIAARDERDLFLKLAGASVKRSIVQGRRVEIGFRAGLALVLLWEGRSGIFSRSGLHGLSGFFLRPRLVGLGNLFLNTALAAGCIYRCHRITP